jgi:hypothetical protein
MQSNVIFFAWTRSIPGREKLSAQHFGEFVQYLTGLQKDGTIHTFETVFLDDHGGDLNGFFLIKGDQGKLDALLATEKWVTHVTRAGMHLSGLGVVRGTNGDAATERFNLWAKFIPA